MWFRSERSPSCHLRGHLLLWSEARPGRSWPGEGPESWRRYRAPVPSSLCEPGSVLGSPALTGAETKASGPPRASLIMITYQCCRRLGGQWVPGSRQEGPDAGLGVAGPRARRFGVSRRGPPGPEARPHWRSAAVTDSSCSGDGRAPRSRPASLCLQAGKRAPLGGRRTRGDPGAGQPCEQRGGALLVIALCSSLLFSELFLLQKPGQQELAREV